MMITKQYKFPIMTIGAREIGYDKTPLVIVELGINHFGDLDTAYRMIDRAVESGAEIIKVQLHNASAEMSKHAKDVKPGNADTSIYDVIDSNSLDFSQEAAIRKRVNEVGLMYMATPFSREAVAFLKDQNPDAVKIGSGEIDHVPLIELACELGKPIVASTGMQPIDGVRPAVSALRKSGLQFGLLHCTNLYPMPVNLARLEGIRELMQEFPDAVVGYSDHSEGIQISLSSIALGSAIVERHFVEDLSVPGPDVSASVDPAMLKELIYLSETVSIARRGYKYLSDEEVVTYKFARSSVIATKDIFAGEELSLENIWAIRPGTGEIPVSDFYKIIGRTAKNFVSSGEQLTFEDISD